MNKIPAGTAVFTGFRFQVRNAVDSLASEPAFFVIDTGPRYRLSRNYRLSDAIATADWLNEAHADGRIK